MLTLKNINVLSDREERSVTSWQPSKIGSCLCGAYLERLGKTPDTEFDERTLRIFETGKIIETMMVKRIREACPDWKIEEQVRIESKELDVTGYADLTMEKDEKYVVEIKSQNSRAFWYTQKKDGGKAPIHQMAQLWLYLHILGIDKGNLLRVSRDDLTLEEHFITKDNELYRDFALGRLAVLKEAWEKKIPPEPAPEGVFESKYCRFHLQCLMIQASGEYIPYHYAS